jgi:hypothetical protein
MNTEMMTQLHTDHILIKVIWEAMIHVFCVQRNDYKQAHPRKLRRTLSQNTALFDYKTLHYTQHTETRQ